MKLRLQHSIERVRNVYIYAKNNIYIKNILTIDYNDLYYIYTYIHIHKTHTHTIFLGDFPYLEPFWEMVWFWCLVPVQLDGEFLNLF